MEIEAGATSVQLVWTVRLLLSPTAMEASLADLLKRTASVKIIVINVEDKERVIKNDVYCGGRHHQADGYTEISPNTLCSVCCHGRHITLQYPDIGRQ